MAKSPVRTTVAQRETAPRWIATALAVLVVLTQVALLPGAASPFRLCKSAVALTGICLIVAIALAGRLRRGELLVPRSPLAAVLLAYPLLQLLSAAWASHPLLSFAAASSSLIWVAGISLLWLLDEEAWAKVALWCAIGAAISSVSMLFQLAGIPLLVIGTTAQGIRGSLVGFTGNPADLAMATLLVLPLLYDRVHSRKGPTRWFLPGFLALAAAITQTLTGYAALILLLLVWLRGRVKRYWRSIILALVIIVVLALLAGVGERISTIVNRVRSGTLYGLFTFRADGWSASLQMVKEHPLLGVGAGCYSPSYYPYRLGWLEEHGTVGHPRGAATHFENAHCDPLQVVAELGLPGLLWMLLLCLLLVRSGRGDPVLPLSAAVAVPFLLIHYPSHLAVGLLPFSLLLARMLRSAEPMQLAPARPALRTALVAAVLVAGAAGCYWQWRRIESDYWHGYADRIVDTAALIQGSKGEPLLREIERRANQRLQGHPEDAARLWRLIANARLNRSFGPGAESAYRTSLELWPHEETELGLGLALAQQGHRDQAIVHLLRVCRTNPTLLRFVPEGLKRQVRRQLDELRAAHPPRERSEPAAGRGTAPES